VRASVVIRARDEAAAIGETLALLGAQRLDHEVVVVDSGSRDDTVGIAHRHGARVLTIPPEQFTYGRALNVGAQAATEPDVVVALSAHAYPRDPDWLGRLVAHFEDDPLVACACGWPRGPDGAPLTEPLRQDAAMIGRNVEWGYSNAAGGFRAALWRARQFREDLPGTEDREWSRWALQHGHVFVADPTLQVDHDHAGDSLRECFDRYAREHRGYAMFVEDLPPYSAGELVREWWAEQGWHRSRARARLDPRRAARLAGKWWGRRAPA
jgi:rhamnosyltransferase